MPHAVGRSVRNESPAIALHQFTRMKYATTVIVIALAVLIAPQPMATDPAMENYLVATRSRPGPDLLGSFSRTMNPVIAFRSVNGFAATLTDDEVRSLRLHPEVVFIEKDPPRYLFRDELRGPSSFEPRVARVETSTQQLPYGLGLIKAPSIWSLATGRGVKVGIVDTGIDLAHPDLEPNIAGGLSFLRFDDSIQDVRGHGTHVAGTVGGLDNDIGVVGVAPDASLYALKVFNANGDFVNASALIEIIDWAIDNGVTILNMSLGGPETSSMERQAFVKARQGGIFVAAAVGNTGDSVPQYPAAYPEAFGVGSVDASSRIAGSSTRGSFVDVVAPGVNVLSTVPEASSRFMLLKNSSLGNVEGSLLANSPRGVISGEWVDCGIGRQQDFPAAVSGRVALIERGELLFADKAKNAKAAGAKAVLIYNNQDSSLNWTLGDDGFDYPLTVGISRADGQAILKVADSVFETSSFQAYGFSSGTSMASPHVAGAAALLRSLVPDASALEIENALISTARDLGDPGYDISYGHGLIDVEAAARFLAPERFEQTRQRPVRR